MFTLKDFVHIVNDVLDEDRKAKGLDVKGYFSVKEIKFADSESLPESIDLLIEYVSDNKTRYPIIRVHQTLSTRVDISIEEERVFKIALRDFYKLLRYGTGEYDYSKFVDGTFNYILTLDLDEISNT